ncbi:hypothetical protein F4861DRAFT_535803 [Xylaria intraflava]|nr:hypothetical protein F4861DRAFT_535803 [Xylaria intraflava]
MAQAKSGNVLSDKERTILNLAWKCLETSAKIDYNKLATLGGYTNPGSARNIFQAAKKKIFAEGDGNGAAADTEEVTPSPAKKRATPIKGKKRQADADSDDEEEEVKKPVAKKTRRSSAGSKAAAAKAAAVEVKEEGEDGEV